MNLQAVGSEALDLHARHLRHVAHEDIKAAHSAAAQTDVTAGAFGRMCSFLVSAETDAITSCRDAIGLLHNAVLQTSEHVESWADIAEEHETGVAVDLTQFRQEMEQS